MRREQQPEIDFVIIWVDGNDPAWRKEKSKYDGSQAGFGDHEIRYRDWGNLQYFFRGVEKYAPFVRKVHFVTWGHLPQWMNVEHPKLHIVNHRDYIPEKYLPTFSSHTIELNLHRIPELAEQFVYFNDDIFLTAPMKPEDFFRNGLPRDVFGESIANMAHHTMGSYLLSNMELINKHFPKSRQLRVNWRKWLSPANGIKQVMKTLPLLLWPYYTNFYYPHLSSSFLKSVMEEVWDQEGPVLDKTCMDRFRMRGNVNQFIFKYWQMASGRFVPRSGSYGKSFFATQESFQEICDAITGQKYQMICINDWEEIEDFEDKARIVRQCFDKILPEKSSFELDEPQEEGAHE